MAKSFSELSESASWAVFNAAVRRGAEETGYKMTRRPGRGRSNIWEFEAKGEKFVGSVRTTKDRWFAFPPLNGGTKWKTLDNVDRVIVAAVDDPDDPKKIEVYSFEAAEVRKRFNAAYTARTKAGLAVQDRFGMWISLDKDDRGLPTSVGSGLSDDKDAFVGKYDIQELLPDAIGGEEQDVDVGGTPPSPATIAEVMTWARDRIAKISGAKPSAIKFDLKIEY